MKEASVQVVRLQFDPASDVLPSGKRLSGGMSAVASFDGVLWLVHDETVSVEQLHATRTRARVCGARRAASCRDRGAREGRPMLPEADHQGQLCRRLLEARTYHAKKDHAEGIAVLVHEGQRVLVMVIYDSADATRRLPPAAMNATLHELALATARPSP